MPTTDFKVTAITSFPQVGKNIELITMPDGDQFAFWSDVLPLDPSDSPSLEMSTTGASATDSVDVSDPYLMKKDGTITQPLKQERVLVWMRMSGGAVISPIRWAGFYRDKNLNEIRPLREVFNPKITYDGSSNVLNLWFWTNVRVDMNNSSSGLYTQDDLIVQNGSTQGCKRVLCVSKGRFVYGKITSGGHIKDYFSDTTTGFYYGKEEATASVSGIHKFGYEKVPVFECPQLIYGKTTETYGMVSDFGSGGDSTPYSFKCSLSGDIVTVQAGTIRLHGIGNYDISTTNITLSSETEWVFAWLSRDHSGSGISSQYEMPTSDTVTFRVPIAQYMRSGDGSFVLVSVRVMGDINVDAPLR